MATEKKVEMLEVVKTVESLQKLIQKKNTFRESVGFVPTMGALHQGHISLVRKSCGQNHITVVSIFVNPTQFNDKNDLQKYPKTLESDLLLLHKTKVDIVFAPDVEDIYPHGNLPDSNLDLGGLDMMMEGRFRPGHFNGMAQVVKRLLDIVKPDRLYMGQKDFQQFTIVQYMIKSLKIPVKLVVCSIIREKNGLAMSSRNVRLSPESRLQAGQIHKTLSLIKRYRQNKTVSELLEYGKKRLSSLNFNVEYLEIVDGDTLKSVSNLAHCTYVVACIAVQVEEVRLIDNIILLNK